MDIMKRVISLLIAVALTVIFIPTATAAGKSEEGKIFDYYGRSALEKMPNSEALLYAYDSIVEGVERSAESISVYNGKNYISFAELKIVIDVYTRDYAHHFWLGKSYSYSYINRNKVTQYIPTYTMSGETLANAKKAFNNAADEILSYVDGAMTDYEKELVIHDRLVSQVDYDLNAPNPYDAYGALVNGRAVCEGYAEAFQYLLHRAGIQSFLVIGSSRGVGHEWNAVRIDGQYYHVDPTWNDQGDEIYHAYFNMSEKMIKEDHAIYITEYQMPECSSMDAHYFNVNNRMIDSRSCSVEDIAGLMKGSIPKVHVFVNGDVSSFLQWYYYNIVEIATEIGVVGRFSYGYSTLGREVILVLDGEVPKPEPEPEYALGDVSGDGLITNADVLVIFRYIYDPELYHVDPKIGDVNHDGEITNADVLVIFRYIYDPELYPIT